MTIETRPDEQATGVQLGELASAYALYREIIDTIPVDQNIQIDYRPEVVADAHREIDKKISTYADSAAIDTAKEKAKHKSLPARQQALLENGFAGTVTELFDRIVDVEAGSDEVNFETLKEDISAHLAVPQEQRLGVKVLGTSGYYWAGKFTPFTAPIKVDKTPKPEPKTYTGLTEQQRMDMKTKDYETLGHVLPEVSLQDRWAVEGLLIQARENPTHPLEQPGIIDLTVENQTK